MQNSGSHVHTSSPVSMGVGYGAGGTGTTGQGYEFKLVDDFGKRQMHGKDQRGW